MRLIFGLILLLLLAALVPVIYFGTADPCRMLAADMAHEAYGPIAELVGNDPDDVPESMEASMRMVTSQMSGRSCAEKLWERWTN